MRRPLLALLLSLSLPSEAQIIHRDDDSFHPPQELPDIDKAAAESQPWPLKLIMQELKNGMLVRLPVIDTDPNRGVTVGVMPIWVLKERGGGDRIRSIHAPSLTYNGIVGVTPTYRYYLYPDDKSDYEFRTSWSSIEEKELVGEFEDSDFLNKNILVHGKLQYNVDASGRFFGTGPDAPKSAESNFTRKTFQYDWRVGLPVFKDSGLKFNFGHHLAGERIAAGPIESLPDIGTRFPGEVGERFHQDGELQLFVDYDSRDDSITTTKGGYAKILVENSQEAWGSEFAFQRYQLDLRRFEKRGRDGRFVTAGRFLFEHLVGNVPFYLKPSLGGKERHRAYGDGRYIDHALMTASLEERVTVHKIPLAGVTTEFEVAPYFELGTVAGAPRRFAGRYARPVLGTAFRAIARPQVVGSIDVGAGREGPSVFMDINYSF